MADNVTADPGAGGVDFRTDEVSAGVHVPYTKLMDGTDGGTAVIPGDATNGLFVQVKASALPTGAATAAAQTTGNGHLATLAGAVSGTEMQVDIVASAAVPVTDNGGSVTTDSAQLPTTIGQKAAAASLSVVLASDQGAVPINDNGGSLTIDAASLPLPTGASTEATLAAASAKLPATLGQKAMAASMAVVLASDQASVPVAATLAAETTKVIGTVNVAAAQTIATTNAGTFAVQAGQAAHDAAIAGNPVRVAGRAMSADYTAVATGDTADLLATLLGKLVTVDYALPANSWNYAAPAGGLVSTTGVTAKAAAGAGIRNYVTKAQIMNSHQTTSTEVLIRDGAAGTVLARLWAQAVGGGIECEFNPPLRGTANTLIEIAEVTATATAGVLVNLQGFTAAE